MTTNPDLVPDTIAGAVQHILDNLTESEREAIRRSPGSHTVHHTIGQHFRNSWSLWEPDTPLKRDAVATYRIAHADDISGLMLEWVWARVRGEDFDPREHVEHYHAHWAKYEKQTSLEAGGWKADGSGPLENPRA